ncbi:MAG TPA: tetratricopeptide repeat protein [Gemmataceae bacterium]|jgi:predicted O-linked N-acetylglucosamine transferase (SPINDLY family)
MAPIADTLAEALRHHQTGDLPRAEALYRQILRADPSYTDALHLLGALAHQAGRYDEAVDLIRAAVARDPAAAVYHFNLGLAYHALGRAADAAACWGEAARLQPDLADAHAALGRVLPGLGRPSDAARHCAEVVRLRPGDPAAYTNLGNALVRDGRPDEAIDCYRRALELGPGSAEAHHNLGSTLRRLGRADDAIDHYRRALAINPDLAETHAHLGTALLTRGEPAAAVAHFRRVAELRPDSADAHNNLGGGLAAVGDWAGAAACFRRAIELNPNFAEAHNNLGYVLKDLRRPDAAAASCRRAVALRPDLANAHTNLGNALSDQGFLDEAVACFRRSLALRPDAKVHGNLLLTLHYRAGATPADLAAAHAEFDRVYAAPLRAAWRPHANDRDPDRRLRLGFVSSDFRRHPVGNYVIRTLENLDRGQAEVVCYSDCPFPDDLTARFRGAATDWRDTCRWADDRLAEQVRADRIDVLFDLGGHTATNRLLVFARKPAPVQVTWAGYEGTTGLAAMDYLIADRYIVPPGAEVHHRERVLRLPDGYVCYDPPEDAPPPAPPGPRSRPVTFGSFNNPGKVTAEVVAAWAEVLRQAPDTRLVLKYGGLDEPPVAGRLAALFVGHGTDPARVEFRGWSPHAAMLAEYRDIDLAVDPFPFNGGVTTCEALWMGVPVVTWPGQTFASRHSLSHLSNVGLTETIADTLDDYVDLAVALACDPARLAALRGGLRERMAASPLCDGRRFADHFLRAIRGVWRDWAAAGG